VSLTNAILVDGQSRSVAPVTLKPGAVSIVSTPAARFTSVLLGADGKLHLELAGTPGRRFPIGFPNRISKSRLKIGAPNWNNHCATAPSRMKTRGSSLSGGLMRQLITSLPSPRGSFETISR
jgi:hypothetical protein